MQTLIKSRTIQRRGRLSIAKRGVRKINQDSLDQYADPQETKRSLDRALADAKSGRLGATL